MAAAASDTIRAAVTDTPLTGSLVRRFVAGETSADAVGVAATLVADGLRVSIDHLGEDTTDAARAEAIVSEYVTLLDALRDAGLAGCAEVSVKLSAIGQRLDERCALDNARRICAAARQAGTAVTVDMEDHTTTDSTLATVAELRRDFPDTGAVVQAYLRRTLEDCRALATEGSRVRLCKGAYAEPVTVAYRDRHEVDLNYVRCVNALLAGPGYPMFATHDPRLIRVITQRAHWYGREPGGYEYQMLYGVRPAEQLRLAALGAAVRVYVPYGGQWYGYLMRRLAERPANVALFLRALVRRT